MLVATLPDVYGISYDSLNISSPTFMNVNGERITQTEKGQQIVISESIENNIYQEGTSLVALVEIRDQNDVTVYLAWQGAKIAFEDSYTFGISWSVPDELGSQTYSVRTFVVTALGDDAQPLSMVKDSTLMVA